MDKEEEKFKELLKKYETGECTAEEIAWLESWYLIWNQKEQLRLSREELDQASPMMWTGITNQITERAVVRLWPRIAVIAAAVAAMVFGVWFYNVNYIGGSRPELHATSHDIAPGKNVATLTLADGKVINLSEAKSGVIIDAYSLKYNDGSAVERKDSDPRHNPNALANLTASTPRGGTYQIVLPDGSKVWLNAASKLNFPSKFEGYTRKVRLSGEAYFEVSKNKKKPFIVVTDKQELTVLGTHFNINAYVDEGIVKTTLLEGSVRVTGSDPQEIVTLLPNQQSILKDFNRIEVKDVEAEEAIAWKKGYFLFAREDIGSVMRKISRWYDVDVVYEEDIQHTMIGGSVSRFTEVSKVLKMMEETGAVKFKIEGRRVYVRK